MRGIKRTHDEYIVELQSVNPNLEVIDKYINAKTKIKHKCKICNYEWELAPLHSLQSKGCPSCARVIHKTQEMYIDEVANKNANVKVIGNYVNIHKPIAHQCNICGYLWEAEPADILSGTSCPKCAIRKNAIAQTKTHSQYIQELKDKNINIIPVDKYVKASIKILHRCLSCGFEWETKPANVLSGFGCPHCKTSKGEHQICEYLLKHNIEFKEQFCFNDCKVQRVMPFDFYLPQHNICIEYDGEHHYKPTRFGGISKEKAKDRFEFQQQKDKIKNKYCQDNKIKLIRIPYWEFENIEDILNKLFSPTTTE